MKANHKVEVGGHTLLFVETQPQCGEEETAGRVSVRCCCGLTKAKPSHAGAILLAPMQNKALISLGQLTLCWEQTASWEMRVTEARQSPFHCRIKGPLFWFLSVAKDDAQAATEHKDQASRHSGWTGSKEKPEVTREKTELPQRVTPSPLCPSTPNPSDSQC